MTDNELRVLGAMRLLNEATQWVGGVDVGDPHYEELLEMDSGIKMRIWNDLRKMYQALSGRDYMDDRTDWASVSAFAITDDGKVYHHGE